MDQQIPMNQQIPINQHYNADRNQLEQENLARLNELRNRTGPHINVESDDFKNIITRAFNIYQTYPYNNLRSWRTINNSQDEINQVQVGQIINLNVSGGGWVSWFYFRPDSNNYVIACLPSFENSNISIHSVLVNPLRVAFDNNINFDNNNYNFDFDSNVPQT